MPFIKEVLLLVIAVLIFLVLYDCFTNKKKLKEALLERLFWFRSLGWVAYLIAIVAVFFLVYSVFFE